MLYVPVWGHFWVTLDWNKMIRSHSADTQQPRNAPDAMHPMVLSVFTTRRYTNPRLPYLTLPAVVDALGMFGGIVLRDVRGRGFVRGKFSTKGNFTGNVWRMSGAGLLIRICMQDHKSRVAVMIWATAVNTYTDRQTVRQTDSFWPAEVKTDLNLPREINTKT